MKTNPVAAKQQAVPGVQLGHQHRQEHCLNEDAQDGGEAKR